MMLGSSVGLPPPLAAYGALIAGYARYRDADMALSALQDFFELGGQPDAQMFDTVLDVCVRTGRFKRAMQVRPWSVILNHRQRSDRNVISNNLASSSSCHLNLEPGWPLLTRCLLCMTCCTC